MSNKINMDQNKKKFLVYIILITVTILIYWQTNNFDFVNLDDNIYVSENDNIKSELTPKGFHWAFTTKYFFLWQPLVWLSFMADYQLFGLDAGGYHITNLILHIASTLLLFWVFNRMTCELWKSAFVAAFFALHPLHVESVAWISERKDVLSAFFWMLTLCCYAYYAERPAIRRYLLVFFSFVLALMSKPMVVTLPAIMILLDYWPLTRFQKRKDNLFLWQLKEKLPLLSLSVFAAMINLYPTKGPFTGKIYTLSSRLANAPISFVIYLEKTFWPHDLAIFYPFPAQIPMWQVSGALLLIIMITVAVIVMAKRRPYLLVGWLWFTIMLIPVIKFIQVGNDAMADRYHYLSSIGLGLMLVWGFSDFINHNHIRRKILFPSGIIILIIFLFLSWFQCGYWKNSITLFSHTVQVTKDNYLAHANLAIALAKKENFKKAVYHYSKAIKIDPSQQMIYENRGKAYAKMEDHQSAIDDFNKVISSKPNYSDAYFHRGISFGKIGQYQNAINDFNKVIELNSGNEQAYNNRGIVLDKLGAYQKAINDFSEAIRLKADYDNAWNNRAFSYLNIGNTKQGCSDAKKACELGFCNTLRWAQKKGFCN